MTYTSPIQEKLDVDSSSAYETLAETPVKGSDNVTHEEFDTLRPVSNIHPLFSLVVIRVC